MKDGSAQDHTSIKFEVSEFNTALDYLTEHFNVLQSHFCALIIISPLSLCD
jgi:ABC-2 type transport system ATP-binding protein